MFPVIYEITASVRTDLLAAFEDFLTDIHIPQLMATGIFSEAKFTRSTPGRYRITYEARSRDALDTYLKDHALELRKHMAEAFPDGIEFSREEWTMLKRFDGSEYQK